jgi:predicted transcriptional regulator
MGIMLCDYSYSQPKERPMRSASLGEQELQILRYISDHAPVSVREVAAHFAETRSLARTTILTVMERLRKKGFLDRTRDGGNYLYSPRREQGALLRDLVRDFADRILEGSHDPFIAYLASDAQLSDEQIADLRRLVDKLERKEHGDES